MAIKRIDFMKTLAKFRKDELVITCWQSIDAWEKSSPSPYNFQSLRTMGDCSTFALGLALARPDKRVIALEGDGSLCMALSSLITIADAAPANLIQFVIHNKIYETTGGQTIPNVDHLDLIGIARGAGIAKTYRISDAIGLEKALPALLKESGPLFVLVDVAPDESHVGGRDLKAVRGFDRECNRRFKEALKCRV